MLVGGVGLVLFGVYGLLFPCGVGCTCCYFVACRDLGFVGLMTGWFVVWYCSVRFFWWFVVFGGGLRMRFGAVVVYMFVCECWLIVLRTFVFGYNSVWRFVYGDLIFVVGVGLFGCVYLKLTF